MSVSGMRKQFHKASQLLNERLIGAEGTKLDEDFITMEKKVAVIQRLVLELMSRTTDYLQPNPAYRAKLSMLATLSRMGGQEKSGGYPQPEGMLGDCMVYYSKQLGPSSAFGGALSEVGVALKQMSCFREGLDICVKQNFIDPLHCLHDNELREIGYHLRKLEGRRLDVDYRIRRRRREEQDEVERRRKREEEDKVAWEKFTASKDLAERSMFTLLQNDVQQVTQLSALIGSFLEFHRHSLQILAELQCRLQTRLTIASNQPRRQFQSKRAQSTTEPTTENPVYQELSIKTHTSPEESEVIFDQPCCRALYSFQPFSERELGFKTGDIIILTNKIDSNWYEGMLGGQSGYLPVSYVDVLVPLPL